MLTAIWSMAIYTAKGKVILSHIALPYIPIENG